MQNDGSERSSSILYDGCHRYETLDRASGAQMIHDPLIISENSGSSDQIFILRYQIFVLCYHMEPSISLIRKLHDTEAYALRVALAKTKYCWWMEPPKYHISELSQSYEALVMRQAENRWTFSNKRNDKFKPRQSILVRLWMDCY